MKKIRFVLAWTLILCLASLAIAQEAKKPEAKQEEAKIELLPPVTTEHSITIDGTKINYEAKVGYFQQLDSEGEPQGYIFYTSYKKIGDDAGKRPLTFCFNGGPGSSSIYLHMLTIGPKRGLLDDQGNTPGPPPTMVDNQFSWLAFTDLVFVDPIGTGFSFPHPGADTSKFWGAHQDAASVADFVRMFLTDNARWMSPILIAGESYGGVRGALLVEELQNNRQIKLNVNGIIFISPAFEYATRRGYEKINSFHLAHYFPTNAATARYHKQLAPELMAMPFDDFFAEVKEWANTEYLIAINRGDSLPEADKLKIAAKMSYYLGLDQEFILQENLRIPALMFRQEILKHEGIQVDRLDARWENGAYELTTTLSPLMNHYVRVELGYKTPKPYVVSGNVRPWPYNGSPSGFSAVPHLANAMNNNRRMKVLVTAGYYDYACPVVTIEFALDRLLLKPEIRKNIKMVNYHTGHMVYTPSKELAEFTQEVKQFILDAVK
jgi:carboxypeptidase C (cathepsin A)